MNSETEDAKNAIAIKSLVRITETNLQLAKDEYEKMKSRLEVLKDIEKEYDEKAGII